jgi:hypothetical protein
MNYTGKPSGEHPTLVDRCPPLNRKVHQVARQSGGPLYSMEPVMLRLGYEVQFEIPAPVAIRAVLKVRPSRCVHTQVLKAKSQGLRLGFC